MPPISAKKFFDKVGSGINKGVTEFSNGVGKAAGGVVGAGIAKYAMDAAPLLLFKTGGRVNAKGKKKGAPVKAILHQGEYVIPIGIPITKAQKKAVAKNKLTERIKSGKLN